MLAISELKLYDILTQKLKLSDSDAKEIVGHIVLTNEKTDKVLDEKLESRFKLLKDIFATKEDLAKTETKLILRAFVFWAAQLGAMFAL